MRWASGYRSLKERGLLVRDEASFRRIGRVLHRGEIVCELRIHVRVKHFAMTGLVSLSKFKDPIRSIPWAVRTHLA